MNTHSHNIDYHAKKRAMERLGIELNHNARHIMIAKMKDGEYKVIGAGFNRQWVKISKNKWFLYDNEYNKIVTFLDRTPYFLTKNGGKK